MVDYRSAPERRIELTDEQSEAMRTLAKESWVRVDTFEPGEVLEVRSRLDPFQLISPGCLTVVFGCVAVGGLVSVAGPNVDALLEEPSEMFALLALALLLGVPVAVAGWWFYHRVRAGRRDGFCVRAGMGLSYSWSEFSSRGMRQVDVPERRLASPKGSTFSTRVDIAYGSKGKDSHGKFYGEDRNNVLRVELRVLAKVGKSKVKVHAALAPNSVCAHRAKAAFDVLLASFEPHLRQLYQAARERDEPVWSHIPTPPEGRSV